MALSRGLQEAAKDMAYARKSGRMSQFRHPGNGLINYKKLHAARLRSEARKAAKSGAKKTAGGKGA